MHVEHTKFCVYILIKGLQQECISLKCTYFLIFPVTLYHSAKGTGSNYMWQYFVLTKGYALDRTVVVSSLVSWLHSCKMDSTADFIWSVQKVSNSAETSLYKMTVFSVCLYLCQVKKIKMSVVFRRSQSNNRRYLITRAWGQWGPEYDLQVGPKMCT